LGLHRDKALIMLAGPVLFGGETGGYAWLKASTFLAECLSKLSKSIVRASTIWSTELKLDISAAGIPSERVGRSDLIISSEAFKYCGTGEPDHDVRGKIKSMAFGVPIMATSRGGVDCP